MLITVIVPTYNRAEFLPVAINSLLRQRGEAELDILIVDDGSTDDTPEVIAKLALDNKEVRHLRQENAGVSGARNTALLNLLPETEIVTFLDSDDALPAGRFAADLPLLLSDPELDLTYGKLRMVEEIDPATMAAPPGARYRDACLPQLSLGLFRRRIIDRTGLFDVALRQAEDIDYLLRMFESGARFLQTETIALFYRRHSGNMTANREEMQRFMAYAYLRSSKRRRADPSRVVVRPVFELQRPTFLEE